MGRIGEQMESLMHECMDMDDDDVTDSGRTQLMKTIDDHIVGQFVPFDGPFGKQNVVYTDFTASGRSLRFIEDYIHNNVLPYYGNTHTTSSRCGVQTSLYREEARQIIRESVNAEQNDVIIFTGSGVTGALHKIIHALDITRGAAPIVFIGPFEHHSNILPWREAGAVVRRIGLSAEGEVNVVQLEQELVNYANQGGKDRLMIGSFSAASNVSGIITDVDFISSLLHKYGAMAFWDYATGAPYLKLDMNPPSCPQGFKDAVFISPHKFVGGIQSPGVVVAKEHVFRNKVPSGVGGGCVLFVRREGHRYISSIEAREEGGTPAIVESIRAGLVFKLKEAVGYAQLERREQHLTKLVFKRVQNIPSLRILGGVGAERLPIFSFLIEHQQSGLYLHFNYVCQLLNDLFGIQARGGCACAGPYGLDILGINEDLAAQYDQLISLDGGDTFSSKELMGIGFSRLNLPYHMSDEIVDYVIKALVLVAQYGWRLLPLYDMDPRSGNWSHWKHEYKYGSLNELAFRNPSAVATKDQLNNHDATKQGGIDLNKSMNQAESLLRGPVLRDTLPDQRSLFTGEAAKLRWFLLPSEAQKWLESPKSAVLETSHRAPFTIPRNAKTISEMTSQKSLTFPKKSKLCTIL